METSEVQQSTLSPGKALFTRSRLVGTGYKSKTQDSLFGIPHMIHGASHLKAAKT